MIYIPDVYLENLLMEDCRYGDLTTDILEIAETSARIEITTRQKCVLCGTSLVSRLLKKVGIDVTYAIQDGTFVDNDITILEAKGTAGAFHTAWRVSMNVLEFCTGITTRTRRLLDISREIKPDIELAVTRKNIPGTRDMSILAIRSAGAFPHRLGLSETVLVFNHHYLFTGGFEKLMADIGRFKTICPEKKLIIEVATLDAGFTALEADVDAVQCDKMEPADLSVLVRKASASCPKTIIIATGGINESNIRDYASTGVQVISTSSVYFGAPVDFGFKLMPL